LVYVTLAGTYIAVSGELALGAADADVLTLQRIELTKGIAFVIVTGFLGFLGARVLLTRIARHRSAIAATQMALVQAEHQATSTILAATLAHDLNNLLLVLCVGLDELDEICGEREDTPELLADIREGVDGVAVLARRLANAGKGILSDPPESVDLGQVVAEAIHGARLHPAVRRARVEHEVESILVLAKRAVIDQLVFNLLVNAAQAGGRGCRIRVTLERTVDGGSCLEVHDDGPGVPPAERERVFAPFHTTKTNGTGLGLLSARLAAALHGGAVSVDASPLGGACFQVTLYAPVDELDHDQLADWAPELGL